MRRQTFYFRRTINRPNLGRALRLVEREGGTVEVVYLYHQDMYRVTVRGRTGRKAPRLLRGWGVSIPGLDNVAGVDARGTFL
jgi:hypothetical protein